MRLKKLFSQTIIYGFAAIFPRLLNLILTPLHTSPHNLSQENYGLYQGLFAYIIMGNVLLTYGMETAFFRFTNSHFNKAKVMSTAAYSLVASTLLFLGIGWFLKEEIAVYLNYPVIFIIYALLILALDTLVVIPFAHFRNEGKAKKYALLRISNVLVNLLLNLFFLLYLPYLQQTYPSTWQWISVANKTEYVFIANTVASLFTLLCVLPVYYRMEFSFDFKLWKKLLSYGFPILIAGVSFSINESFDRIFIKHLISSDNSDAVVGVYAACYKMGVFMTLFITAYRLGVEPFFFNNSKEQNATNTYAQVTYYFSLTGAYILLFVSVFTDVFKWLLIPNPLYWNALNIVPFILLANLCLGLYHSISVWYKVTDRTHYGAIISVIGCGITLIGNYFLVPKIGYMGAAITTLLAYGSMLVISFSIGQQKYYIPYKTLKIVLFFGVSCGFSFAYFFILERNIVIGISFLLLYSFALLYYHWEIIKHIIQNIRTKVH